MLRRGNPAHEALLDAEAAACGVTPEDAPPGSSGGVPRVKRERDAHADGAVVDLTGGMRQRRCTDPSVLESCDLTVDEEAPVWTAKKKWPGMAAGAVSLR